MKELVIIFLSIIALAQACRRPGLVLKSESSRTCAGQQVVFECTIVGSAIQFTVWRGNALALDCTSGIISLRHGQFIQSGYANATCNSGAILASITNITGNCYVSQLIVNTTLSLNNKNVECVSDDGSVETVIDTKTIRIITG